MPDLRKDADLDRVASRVLEILEQKIPQIRGYVVPPPANIAGTGVTASLSARPISSQHVLPSSHPAYEALKGMDVSDGGSVPHGLRKVARESFFLTRNYVMPQQSCSFAP